MRSLLLATSLIACGTAPELNNQDLDLPDIPPTERLATVDAGSSELHFDVDLDGMVYVTEISDVAAKDVLPILVAEGATPLEMFLALSDEPAPVPLVDNHEDYGESLGASLEPRELDLKELGIRGQGAPPPFMSKTLKNTSCRYASDKPWFDGVAPSWNWRWYVSSSNQVRFTPSRSTSVYYSHLCNYTATGGNVDHCLTHVGGSGGICNTVPTGKRSTLFTFGNSQTWYAFNFMTASGNYKLGAISP